MNELKKKNAGSNQRDARKQETRTQNQRNAILRALETHQGHRRKHKSKNPRGDLQVALQDGIRRQVNLSEPVGRQENQHEAGGVEQYTRHLAFVEHVRKLVHSSSPVSQARAHSLSTIRRESREACCVRNQCCERRDIRCGKCATLSPRTGWAPGSRA